MTPSNETRSQRRQERSARRFERSERHAGDRGGGYSPSIVGSAPAPKEERDFWLNREIEMLQRALAEQGEMKRGDLGREVGCRYWGPGRFASALRAAVSRGAIERTGFGRYGPRR